MSTTQYRWLAGLWTVAILVACSVPATTLSSVGPALSYDKIAHVVLFAVFGGLWMRALSPPHEGTARRNGLLLLLVGSVFAVLTEAYQHLLPIRRHGDPFDALADGVGIVVGVGFYVLYVRRRNERTRRPEASPNPKADPEGSG